LPHAEAFRAPREGAPRARTRASCAHEGASRATVEWGGGGSWVKEKRIGNYRSAELSGGRRAGGATFSRAASHTRVLVVRMVAWSRRVGPSKTQVEVIDAFVDCFTRTRSLADPVLAKPLRSAPPKHGPVNWSDLFVRARSRRNQTLVPLSLFLPLPTLARAHVRRSSPLSSHAHWCTPGCCR
jgi:hypothetical protein